MKPVITLSIVALAIALPFAATAAGITTPAADKNQTAIATGRTLFSINCAICHKASGAGGVHFGSAVSANLQSPHLEKLYSNSDALIARAILEAKDQNDQPLDHPMPAWQGRLSRIQAQDIIDYLRTLHS